MFVENMVRATLISNAGLLLEYRGVKLMVVAIYHTTDPLFASGVTNRQRANSRQLTGEYV